MNIINVFIATALFAPALPFVYVMIFITGAVRLHASKFEIIYFKRRILPIKTNSINWWLFIIEIISFLSIITNVGKLVFIQLIWYTLEESLLRIRPEYSFCFLLSSSALSITCWLNTGKTRISWPRGIRLKWLTSYWKEVMTNMTAFLKKSIRI